MGCVTSYVGEEEKRAYEKACYEREEAAELHLAQLAAREHVVPHVIAAARAARAAGDEATAECYNALALVIDGSFDPKILQYGAAFLRFVAGGKSG